MSKLRTLQCHFLEGRADCQLCHCARRSGTARVCSFEQYKVILVLNNFTIQSHENHSTSLSDSEVLKQTKACLVYLTADG